VESAAKDIQAQLQAVIGGEASKKDALVQAVTHLEAAMDNTQKKNDLLSGDVRAVRDQIIQEANMWYEQHLQRLQFVALCKEEALTEQETLLQPKIGELQVYLHKITSALSGPKAMDYFIITCLNIMDKVRQGFYLFIIWVGHVLLLLLQYTIHRER